MEGTVSYAVPPNALRVFHGFRNNDLLGQDRYLEILGQTFMPGTPYMLAPLGLAAYLPGVVVGEQDPGVLNEFAIIAYTSQRAWEHIMKQTLRGRVYDQTHGGVYDMKRSGASFPAFVEHLPPIAADPYYLFDCATDWQLGTTRVFVGAPASPKISPVTFREALRTFIQKSIPDLRTSGFDQCVVMPADNYVVIWAHANGPVKESFPQWEELRAAARAVAILDAHRIVCAGEPPPITLTQTAALNFIFLRNSAMFLR